jgi:hypothetical protein
MAKKDGGTRRWKTNECEEEKIEQLGGMEGYRMHLSAPPSARCSFGSGQRRQLLMPK